MTGSHRVGTDQHRRPDADGDGVPEKTDNRVEALTLHMQNEPINWMTNRNNGRRESSDGWSHWLRRYVDEAVLHGRPVVFTALLPAR